MSLAETHRGTYIFYVPEAHVEPRWLNRFNVEEVCTEEHDFGEEDVTVPPHVDSKVLFRESLRIPISDRNHASYGRFLHSLRSREAHYTYSVFEMQPEEQLLLESVELLSRITAASPDELKTTLKQMCFNWRAHTSPPRQPETVLESFEGYVDEVDGDTAYVTLESRNNGDVLQGKYSASELLKKGIEEQSRFLCRTIKSNGSTRVDVQPLPDAEVTDEEVRAISEEIDRAFPSDDSGIKY
jgi:hypothetical protein